jgi:uroporphyrinogen decarboxylase
MSMTRRERLAAAVAGAAVDRVPVALWRHFPVDDVSAEELAVTAAAFQHQYDWDFIKLTPSSHYSVADWGTTAFYRGHPHGTSEYITYAVKTPEDWGRLQPLDVQAGILGDQLTCVRRLRELVGDEVPIIETIFSPLDQVRHLVGRGNELVHLRRYPQAVRAAIEVIMETTLAFVRAVIAAGADGIFYATQYAQADQMSQTEYEEVCRPLDLRVLEAAQGGTFSLLHVHGVHTYFDVFVDYPVQAINWHDRETGPTLAEGAQRFPGLVVGGVSQKEIVEGKPEQIRAIARQAIAETGGRRMALSTGCVLPTVAPWGNIRALRGVVDE